MDRVACVAPAMAFPFNNHWIDAFSLRVAVITFDSLEHAVSEPVGVMATVGLGLVITATGLRGLGHPIDRNFMS